MERENSNIHLYQVKPRSGLFLMKRKHEHASIVHP